LGLVPSTCCGGRRAQHQACIAIGSRSPSPADHELALPRIITGSSLRPFRSQLREMRGTDADPNAVAVSSLLLLALLFVFSVLVIRRSRGGIAGIIPTLEKD
jgi:hypothetical protein